MNKSNLPEQQIIPGKFYDLQPLPPLDPSPLALFAAMIGVVGIAVAVILIITNGLDRLARLERAAQVAAAESKTRLPVGACDEPRKNGDRAVIIVRRVGAQLAVECNPLLDWREPMRSLKK